MKEGCKKTYRLKCHTNISDEERSRIFREYWKLGDNKRQWDYIARYIRRSEPSERKVDSSRKIKKQFIHKYFLPTPQEEDTFGMFIYMYIL